jgi:hypothetical protein
MTVRMNAAGSQGCAGTGCLFHILPTIVVRMVHSAVLPVALGVNVSPIQGAFLQQVPADIPHDAGFTADPYATVTLRERKLLHGLLQFPPYLSQSPAAVEPGHLKTRRRFEL